MTSDQISQFEKKVIIRNIVREDFDKIIELQNICFPNMHPWKKEQLESHIRIFPEGQICVELDGEIIGSCSSLIVNFDDYLEQHTYSEITDKGYIDGIAGECSENTESVIMAEVDMETLLRFRKSKDVLTFRDRRTDIYSLQIRS